MTAIKKGSCKLTFECTKKWSELTGTSHEGIRHCSSCDENVHWCDTQEDIDHAKKKGWCVAYRDKYKINKPSPDECDYIESTVGMLSCPSYETHNK
jgi:hypothetical protein